MARANRLPHGFFCRADIQEYRWLVSRIPDGGTLVELGVWIGRSLCSVADLVRAKGLTVIAVDTFMKKGAWGGEVLTRPQQEVFLANMRRFGVEPVCVTARSDEAARLVPGKVGMVFIDADHAYASVKADIAAWQPKVTTFLAGHDYAAPRFGVTQAVDEVFPDARVRGYVWSVRV